MGRAMSTKRLLDHADLRERKGIKYTSRHLRTLVAEHRFPVPFAMGAKLVWLESEIDEWISALPRARAVPVAGPAPISTEFQFPRKPNARGSTAVPLPHRRFRRRRSANSEAARAEAAWRGTLAFMA
jgi:predicted DNA-binding transcriptional regulator AlpA